MQASTISRGTKASMSVRNSAPYSPAALIGSSAYACSTNSSHLAHWVHQHGRRPPHQRRAAVLAVVVLVGVPQNALAAVGRRRHQQHGAGNGRHAGPDRFQHGAVRLGGVLVGGPIGDLIEQGGYDCVAATLRNEQACTSRHMRLRKVMLSAVSLRPPRAPASGTALIKPFA